MRIFICEDNPIVTMMLEDIVADLGHSLAGTADMAEPALRGCLQSGADLALVDLDLADGPTGLGLVRDLAHHGIPSIVVSGQVATVPPGHLAAALVAKPIDERVLAGAIASVTQREAP